MIYLYKYNLFVNTLKRISVVSIYEMVKPGLLATCDLERYNPLEGLVLYEPIDANLLQKCIESDLLKTNYKDDKWFANEKTQLENYLLNVERNVARVEYRRVDGFKIGRVLPVRSRGLHSLSRRTRHTLVKGVMRDVDIENAHVIMFLQILKANNYQHDLINLEDYCSNRESWREAIKIAFKLDENKYVKTENDKEKATPKEIAKDLIIRIMYGGSLSKWKKDWEIKEGETPTKVVNLIKDIKKMQRWVCDNNPQLYEKCKENNMSIGKDYNHEGTTTSWFLQDRESLILEHMYQYCVENDYIKNDVCSLCNDGIMLEDKYYKPELLDELSVEIEDKLGFKLKYTEKALDEGYGDILDNHINFDLWRMDTTDGLYADYFKLLYCDKFLFRHGFSYHYNGIYWEQDETRKHASINSYVDNQFKTYIVKRTFSLIKKVKCEMSDYEQKKFLNDNKKPVSQAEGMARFRDKYKIPCPETPPKFKGDLVIFYLNAVIRTMTEYIKRVDKYLRNVSTRDKLVKDICRIATCNWIQLDADEFLLAFLNKIYDLRSGKWVSPHYTQYISLTTGWKWVSGYSNKYKKELIEVLKQIFPNEKIRDHYLQVLSTGIYGKVVQHFFVAKGVGGNGKSVLNSLMMKTVGKYGYKLPSTAVGQVIKEGANPAIANLNNKRFVLVQEPDRKHKINCSTVKEITGDKELNCRTLYSTDTFVRLLLTLVMECNDLPQLDESGDAIGRRIDVSPFDSKFLTEARWNARTEAEKQSDSIHKANPYYTSDAFQDQFKQALMEILMEHFKKYQENGYVMKPPVEIIHEANEYLKYSDDFYGWWNDRFVDIQDNIVPFKAIWDDFSCSDYFTNLTKKDKRRYNQKKLKETICSNQFLKDKFYTKGRSYNGQKLTCDSVCGVDFAFNHQKGGDADEIDEDIDGI